MTASCVADVNDEPAPQETVSDSSPSRVAGQRSAPPRRHQQVGRRRRSPTGSSTEYGRVDILVNSAGSAFRSPGRGVPRGQVRLHPRPQPQGHLPVLPGVRAQDARPGQGQHHQPRLDRRRSSATPGRAPTSRPRAACWGSPARSRSSGATAACGSTASARRSWTRRSPGRRPRRRRSPPTSSRRACCGRASACRGADRGRDLPRQRRLRAGDRPHPHVRRRVPDGMTKQVGRPDPRPSDRSDRPRPGRHDPPPPRGARSSSARGSCATASSSSCASTPRAGLSRLRLLPDPRRAAGRDRRPHDRARTTSGEPVDDPAAAFLKALWSNNAVHAAGIGMRALSVVDIAAWDLAARPTGQSIAAYLGGERRRMPVTGIVGYPPSIGPDETVAQIRGALGGRLAALQAAHRARRPTSRSTRLRAAREAFPDAWLGIDANFFRKTAGRRDRVRAPPRRPDIGWFEDIVPPGDAAMVARDPGGDLDAGRDGRRAGRLVPPAGAARPSTPSTSTARRRDHERRDHAAARDRRQRDPRHGNGRSRRTCSRTSTARSWVRSAHATSRSSGAIPGTGVHPMDDRSPSRSSATA